MSHECDLDFLNYHHHCDSRLNVWLLVNDFYVKMNLARQTFSIKWYALVRIKKNGMVAKYIMDKLTANFTSAIY